MPFHTSLDPRNVHYWKQPETLNHKHGALEAESMVSGSFKFTKIPTKQNEFGAEA